MVDHELTLTYADLLERQRSEMWLTLNCVSNPVGGDLIGNAWWSGVRLKDLLAGGGRAVRRGRREADVGRRLDLRDAALGD